VLKGSLRLSIFASPSSTTDVQAMAVLPFREVVGCLMYAALTVRFDIAFMAGQLAQHCQNPGMEHWKAAIQVLRYLKATRNHGLCFGGNDSNNHVLVGYSDADYAGTRILDVRLRVMFSFSLEVLIHGLVEGN
jgi:hypothetical protein